MLSDDDSGFGSPLVTGKRGQPVSHMGQDIDQVALLRVNELLNLGQLILAKSLLCKLLQ